MTQPFTLPEHSVILMLKHIVKMQILDQVQNDTLLHIVIYVPRCHSDESQNLHKLGESNERKIRS